MSESNNVNYFKLSKEYERHKHRLIFTKEVVMRILKEKFNAEEIPKKKILDLEGSDQVNHKYVFAAFSITNSTTLDALFTSEEKREHQEEIEDNKNHHFDWSNVTPGEEEFVQWGLDWQEGRRITLVLESQDNKYVSGWDMRADSIKLNCYLNALTYGPIYEQNKKKGRVDTEYFHYYLDNLNKFGFLNKK
ncbi:hypothetical protein MUB24_11980 [Lederbergia sp. NSJ-179]|uniref:hypothetical protein n=1 Tax=Lederbergia sp. NSJ-179 TaxID=2931402 RepID=UPI001FD471BC|nr:hypothetical protein [Lederbergia sp. NSJ-179]MCJ7841601.1 hypothetical protein [Lederbergia sp. NSJ-179]